MEVEFEWGEESHLYEAAVEEIALEGLDGITLQALFERLVDRENNAPINKSETGTVLQSLWNAVKKDTRFRFYLLPEPRPTLRIWNRYLHYTVRDTVEEPKNAPKEIYAYKCIEARNLESTEARERMKSGIKTGRSRALPKNKVRRIKIFSKQEGEIELEGIRFSDDTVEEKPGKKKEKKKQKEVEKASSSSKIDVGESDEGTVALRGSCFVYDKRLDITEGIRKANLSYNKAVTMLRHRLVIVASQFLRESLLFQTANQIEISGLQYCVVERAGRARHYGEQARGNISLTVMGIDAKTLFYIRKVLLSEGYISKQPLIMRFGDSKTGTLISVFHLPHFFRLQESPETIKIRKIFAYIFNAPNHIVDYFKLQGVFGKYIMRTLNEEYREFVRVEEVLYSSVYPEEVEAEMSAPRKEALLKRKLRIITLRHDELSLREIIEKQLVKQVSAEADGEDEDPLLPSANANCEDQEDSTFDWTYCYGPERELAHECETTQILRLMISKGSKGLVQTEMAEEMSITCLDARSALRYLTRWKIAISSLENHGNRKTKINRWRYFKCKKEKIKEDLVLDAETPAIFPSTSFFNEEEEEEEGEQILPGPATASKKKLFVWKGRKKFLPPEIASTSKILKPAKERPIKKEKVKKEKVKKSKIKKPEPLAKPPTENGDPLSFAKKGRKRQMKKRKRNSDEDEEDPPPLVKRKRVRQVILDFADLEAKSIRERQRADWSADEDRAVLYVFFASVLFIPRYNLDKIFVYNATQMRDVLHKNFPVMKTKTSAIIRRRVHSMFKFVNLYSRYRTMLDIALRDEQLYTTLIEPFLPPPSLTVFNSVPNNALEAVTHYLSAKFGNPTELSNQQIPGRLDDLEALLDARELRRMETIWMDVWANVFSLFYRKKEVMKTPMQPGAVHQLQNEGLVIEDEPWILPPNRPRSPTPEIELPSVYTDDQLEAVYKAATTLTSTAYRVINEEPPSSSSSEDEEEDEDVMIINDHPSRSKAQNNTKIIMLQPKGKGGYVPDLFSCERNPSSSNEIFAFTCRSIFMSVLLGGGGDQKSLKTFMESIPDNILDSVLNSLRSLGVFLMAKQSRRLVLTNQMKRKLTNYIHPSAFRATHSIHTSLQNESGPTSFLDFNNMGASYLLGEIAALVNIQCIMPRNIITVKEEWREDYESLLASHQSKVQSGEGREELVLRLLRLKLNADNEKGKLVEKDFFDINLPKIELHLNEDVPLNQLIHGETLVHSEKQTLENRLIQIVELDEAHLSLDPRKRQQLGNFESLYYLIDIAGDVGVSIALLLKYWTREEVKEGLAYLLSCRYVYVVGIRHRKFVSVRNMKQWSTLVTKNDEEGFLTSYRIVMRPWINANGEVNWKLIDRVIVGILGNIQRHSHTFIGQIICSLSPLFSHVEILILISALVELQIVDAFRIREEYQHKFCLYSKWTDIDEEDVDHLESPVKDYGLDTVLDIEEAWIELLPFHMSKYSRIQSIILPVAERQNLDIEQKQNLEGNVVIDIKEFVHEDVEIMVAQDEEEDEEDEDNFEMEVN